MKKRIRSARESVPCVKELYKLTFLILKWINIMSQSEVHVFSLFCLFSYKHEQRKKSACATLFPMKDGNIQSDFPQKEIHIEFGTTRNSILPMKNL